MKIFPPDQSRSGIYFLVYANGGCYIGQAKDVTRRFREHKQKYPSIIQLAFFHTKSDKTILEHEEERLIQEAEVMELPLTNKTLVNNIRGITELDSILPADDQELWKNNPQLFRHEPRLITDPDQRHRYQHRYDTFTSLEISQTVHPLLHQYIHECIPAYGRTEYSFWSVSCLPSKSQAYFRINSHTMEIFSIGYLKKNSSPEELYALAYISRSVLDKKIPELLLRIKYPFAQIGNSTHKAGGTDQISIQVFGLEAIERLLTDKRILNSARDMNLRLIRKGHNLFQRYHCFQLTDGLYE